VLVNTPLAGTSLVLGSSGVGSRESSPTTNETGSPSRPLRSVTSTGEPGQTPASDLESIRENTLQQEFRNKLLLLAGWSQGTNSVHMNQAGSAGSAGDFKGSGSPFMRGPSLFRVH